jgi:hypothetical protein
MEKEAKLTLLQNVGCVSCSRETTPPRLPPPPADTMSDARLCKCGDPLHLTHHLGVQVSAASLLSSHHSSTPTAETSGQSPPYHTPVSSLSHVLPLNHTPMDTSTSNGTNGAAPAAISAAVAISLCVPAPPAGNGMVQ